MTLPPCTHCAGTGQGPPPGAELRRLREAATPSASCAAVARAVGKTPSFVAEVERGKKPAPPYLAKYYRETFDEPAGFDKVDGICLLDDMIGGDGEKLHAEADEALLTALNSEGGQLAALARAFRAARKRCFEGHYS